MSGWATAPMRSLCEVVLARHEETTEVAYALARRGIPTVLYTQGKGALLNTTPGLRQQRCMHNTGREAYVYITHLLTAPAGATGAGREPSHGRRTTPRWTIFCQAEPRGYYMPHLDLVRTAEELCHPPTTAPGWSATSSSFTWLGDLKMRRGTGLNASADRDRMSRFFQHFDDLLPSGAARLGDVFDDPFVPQGCFAIGAELRRRAQEEAGHRTALSQLLQLLRHGGNSPTEIYWLERAWPEAFGVSAGGGSVGSLACETNRSGGGACRRARFEGACSQTGDCCSLEPPGTCTAAVADGALPVPTPFVDLCCNGASHKQSRRMYGFAWPGCAYSNAARSRSSRSDRARGRTTLAERMGCARSPVLNVA